MACCSPWEKFSTCLNLLLTKKNWYRTRFAILLSTQTKNLGLRMLSLEEVVGPSWHSGNDRNRVLCREGRQCRKAQAETQRKRAQTQSKVRCAISHNMANSRLHPRRSVPILGKEGVVQVLWSSFVVELNRKTPQLVCKPSKQIRI